MGTPKIAALVAVDVSPLWMYGHTLAGAVTPRLPWGDDLYRISTASAQMQMALASERVHDLLAWAYETARLPWFVVESMHLNRFDLSDFKGKGALALCGVYGDACVLAAARFYEQQGFEVLILQDACLWEFRPDEYDGGEFAGIPLINTAAALPAVPVSGDSWAQTELLSINKEQL